MTDSRAIEIIEYIKTFDEMNFGAANIALNMSIKAFEVINSIADIIKIEQQSTSCEYTKFKNLNSYECTKGKEIPEGKMFEFCPLYERKERSEYKDLFKGIFGGF